jgi:hypothetical protein
MSRPTAPGTWQTGFRRLGAPQEQEIALSEALSVTPPILASTMLRAKGG